MTAGVDTDVLLDRFGRFHRDLRISLTDRCSLRCTYCMPAEGLPWLPASSLLTPAELTRIAGVLVEVGIREIRLTGGEPLLRPDVVDIVRSLVALPGPDGGPEVSLTTNGLRLATLAAPLAEAGLARVNVSLDTLRPDRFYQLTRRDRLDDVLAGIDVANDAGLRPVKLNAVVLRGVNDDEVNDLVRFAVARGLTMRFIEQMPLDPGHTWDRREMVSAEEILARLGQEFTLTEVALRGASPAQEWLVNGGPARVGVIASVTAPFCAGCDRLRLTADGALRSCLFAAGETDLRTPLRDGADDDEVRRLIGACVAGKKAGHDIGEPGFLQPPRPMSAIGG